MKKSAWKQLMNLKAMLLFLMSLLLFVYLINNI